MYNSLWPCGLQHARLPCPSPSPVRLPELMSIESVMPSNHLIFCRPFLLLPSVFPSISLFQWVYLLASGSQSIGASASASVLPVNIQGLFPLRIDGLLLLFKRLSRVFSSTTVKNYQFFSAQPSLWRRQWQPTPVLVPGKSHGRRSVVACSPWGCEGWDTTKRLHFHFSLSCIGEGNGNPLQCSCRENPRDRGAWWTAVYGVAQSLTRLKGLSSSSSSLLYGPTLTSIHDNWKTKTLTIQTFVSKLMSLLFNILSRFVIAFLPRDKCILISWMQSSSAVILEPKKMKSVTASTFPSSICQKVMGLDAMIIFWTLSFKPAFSFSSLTLIKRLFSSSSISAIKVVSSAYQRLLILLPEIMIPTYDSSSPAFCMMCSAYNLNKQMTIYSFDVLLSQFWTSVMFHVQL